MREETPHVSAMLLWHYASGSGNLAEADFEHLLFCVECQCLVSQFIDILDGLPQLDRGGTGRSPTP
jgi:hypothetical protein